MGLAFLITSENLQLLSERKVLKESEYSALLNATEVINAARKEASRIVQQSIQQAEASKKLGYQQGLEQAKAEYAQQLIAGAGAVQRELHALRGAMGKIVVKAVGQFVNEFDAAQLLQAALKRIDSLVRTEPFITLRVAVEEEALVRQALDQLHAEMQWLGNVAINPDPALSKGKCTLQTSSGTLEIGVQAQLEAFRKAVEHGGVRQPAG
jgi:type III secretion protein L